MIRLAVKLLGPVCERVVFLGGASVDLLVTEEAHLSPRRTKDVDAIVEVAGKPGFGDLEHEMRSLGFSNDMTSSVICRWIHGSLILDVMPTDGEILGFGNRWYEEAFDQSVAKEIEDGKRIQVIAPVYF